MIRRLDFRFLLHDFLQMSLAITNYNQPHGAEYYKSVTEQYPEPVQSILNPTSLR